MTRTPPPLRALETWLMAFRHAWRGAAIASVLNPTLFLAAMGVGLGRVVDESGTATETLGGVEYLAFLAPGLLAAAAVQAAAGEATYPVMAGIKWTRTYHAMIATPLRVVDVLAGHLSWIALRVFVGSAVFLVVMALFGAVTSWMAVLAVPAATLAGLSMAAPIAAYSATLDGDAPFAALLRFVVTPMFLFSGTFFPVSELPAWLRPVAWLTPLWHGVSLCRDLALARADLLPSLGHAAYLGALVALGVRWGTRTFSRRLTS